MEAQRYQICDKWQKKSSSFKAKLWQIKMFFRKATENGNE